MAQRWLIHHNSNVLGRSFLILGAVFLVLGLILVAGERWPAFRLGRLPGDLVWEQGSTRVYFPLMTMLLVSGLISLVLALVRSRS